MHRRFHRVDWRRCAQTAHSPADVASRERPVSSSGIVQMVHHDRCAGSNLAPGSGTLRVIASRPRHSYNVGICSNSA